MLATYIGVLRLTLTPARAYATRSSSKSVIESCDGAPAIAHFPLMAVRCVLYSVVTGRILRLSFLEIVHLHHAT